MPYPVKRNNTTTEINQSENARPQKNNDLRQRVVNQINNQQTLSQITFGPGVGKTSSVSVDQNRSA